MPYCIVPTCVNNSTVTKKKDGVTYHLFPYDNRRKAGWIKIIRNARLDKKWCPSKGSRICSAHFKEKYFYTTHSGLRRLHKIAVPSRNLVPEGEKNEPQTDYSGTSSPNSDDECDSDESASDIESTLDLKTTVSTPREIEMNAQLRRKQIIIKQKDRKIKVLRRKIRRLSESNRKLKTIVQKLTKPQCPSIVSSPAFKLKFVGNTTL